MGENFLSLNLNIAGTGVEAWEKWINHGNPGTYAGTFNDRIRNQILIHLVKWGNQEKGLNMACGEGSLNRALAISGNAIEMAKRNYPAANIENL